MQTSTVHTQTQGTPATDYGKGIAKLLLAFGAILCITPAALLGVGLVVAMGTLLAFSPVAAQAETQMIEETRATGNGCAALAWALFVVALGGIAALVAGLGAIELVTP